MKGEVGIGLHVTLSGAVTVDTSGVDNLALGFSLRAWTGLR